MALPALPAAAVPALLLLLGAGAARACSADRVRIGPHDYRRVHSLANEADKHAYILVNYKDLALLSTTHKIDVHSPRRIDSLPVDLKVLDIFQSDATYFITYHQKQKLFYLYYFVNKLHYRHHSSVFSEFLIKRCMFLSKSDFVFYTDHSNNLFAQVRYSRPSQKYEYFQLDMFRKVYCFGHHRDQYYFYTGKSVDSLRDSSVEDGPRVVAHTKTPLDVRSMVFDKQQNLYLCHSRGLTMVNKRLPGGLEEFRNFTDCRGLAFVGTHVFLRSGSVISKYHRCPEATRYVTPPRPAPTAATTSTPRTKKTGKTTTPPFTEDAEFIRHDGHTSDYIIPLIVFGYLVAALSLFGCLGYLVFNFTEKRCADLASRFPCWADGDSDSEC